MERNLDKGQIPGRVWCLHDCHYVKDCRQHLKNLKTLVKRKARRAANQSLAVQLKKVYVSDSSVDRALP